MDTELFNTKLAEWGGGVKKISARPWKSGREAVGDNARQRIPRKKGDSARSMRDWALTRRETGAGMEGVR
jgi:hypothetical protein